MASVDNEWCFLRKFVGKQLRHNAYKVHRDDIFKIPGSGGSSGTEPQEGKHIHSAPFTRSAPSSQSFVPAPYVNDRFETPIRPPPPPAPMAAPPIPVEITEPAPSVSENDVVVGAQVDVAEALAQEPPSHSQAAPSRTQGRTRRPPSYLADYDLS